MTSATGDNFRNKGASNAHAGQTMFFFRKNVLGFLVVKARISFSFHKNLR